MSAEDLVQKFKQYTARDWFVEMQSYLKTRVRSQLFQLESSIRHIDSLTASRIKRLPKKFFWLDEELLHAFADLKLNDPNSLNVVLNAIAVMYDALAEEYGYDDYNDQILLCMSALVYLTNLPIKQKREIITKLVKTTNFVLPDEALPSALPPQSEVDAQIDEFLIRGFLEPSQFQIGTQLHINLFNITKQQLLAIIYSEQ